jgi:hypothetical protein
MSKDKKEAQEKDGPLAVACRKREGQYEVFTVRREGGRQLETVLRATPDKRIAADKLQDALFRSGL